NKAAQNPGGKFPPGFGQDFSPDKFLEQLFGRAGVDLNDDAELEKIEITPAEEARLGQQALDGVKNRLGQQKVKLLEKGQEVQYLSRLVELIQPQMTQAKRYRKLQVYLADMDDPDACTLPGGHVIFSRGLLEAAGCEAALVCVAGHELAHLDRGHLLRRSRQWKLAQQRMSAAPGEFSFDKLLQMNQTMMQLFRRPFGPEEELEADRDGITWAYRAGYDPRALATIYQAFDAAGKNPPEFLPAFFRTHPLTAERRENLTQTFATLQAAEPKGDLYLGRENLARRLTRAEREFAE
ncbi:MAG TPA: M48 family metallopeptidase, partial [Pirellulaceae bacterium]|nr:M48 family metallopeptidase [Pirellulaceae bacterium]